MKKLIAIIKRRRSLVLASAFAPMCFGVLIGGGGLSQEQRMKSPRPRSFPRPDIKTINKTTSLEVTLESISDHRLVVRLKNLSSKDLNGYEVDITNKVRITTDLSSGDRFIPSGQTHEMDIPLDSSPLEIKILAAMFTDGSIEGEPKVVEELKQWRLGLKEELTRSLPELDAMLESTDTSVARLSVSSDGSSDGSAIVQAGVASGAQAARDSLNTEVGLLRKRLQRDGTLKQKDGLLELRKRLERRIASL